MSIFSEISFFKWMKKVFISVDLGGTKCSGALVTEDGAVINTSTEKVAGQKERQVSETVCRIIHKMDQQVSSSSVSAGIGVSVPGISYQEEGTVWAPNIPGWENFPLMEEIQKEFGNGKKIHIDSDRACSISGEVWLGAARGCKNVIYLAIGTGIGAGIMIEGRILRGVSDIAGAIGWMALDHHYPPGYSQFGCFEYNASGDGLSRLAGDIYHAKKVSTAMDPGHMTAEEIFKGYNAADPLAKETIDLAMDYWAKAVANLVSIFNPEMIIFGGGVFGPGLQLLEEIYDRSKKWAQPVAIQQVRLKGGHLGGKAHLLGAAKLVMDSINS